MCWLHQAVFNRASVTGHLRQEPCTPPPPPQPAPPYMPVDSVDETPADSKSGVPCGPYAVPTQAQGNYIQTSRDIGEFGDAVVDLSVTGLAECRPCALPPAARMKLSGEIYSK